MNPRHRYLFALLLFFCVALNAQILPINPDSLNLAVLVVDYNTYAFEGGNLSYYEKCTCSNDSLPFIPDFNSPGDFGGISFTLEHTGDTIFDATIIWMGTGQIYYPSEFSMQWPFEYHDLAMPKPVLEYFDWSGQKTNDPAIIQKADSAWDVVDSLIITSFFANYDYKTGIYLYPPTVGMFDPGVAKWIIFLYYSEVVYSEISNRTSNQITMFPNPCRGQLSLTFGINEIGKYQIEIFNQVGQKMSFGRIVSGEEVRLDLSGFATGIYFLRSSFFGQIATTKIIKL